MEGRPTQQINSNLNKKRSINVMASEFIGNFSDKNSFYTYMKE